MAIWSARTPVSDSSPLELLILAFECQAKNLISCSQDVQTLYMDIWMLGQTQLLLFLLLFEWLGWCSNANSLFSLFCFYLIWGLWSRNLATLTRRKQVYLGESFSMAYHSFHFDQWARTCTFSKTRPRQCFSSSHARTPAQFFGSNNYSFSFKDLE